MKLLRIGAAGSEKPAALVGDSTYVDLSDVVTDFDEAFFGSGGIERVRGVVAERAAAGQVHELGSQRVGVSTCASAPCCTSGASRAALASAPRSAASRSAAGTATT